MRSNLLPRISHQHGSSKEEDCSQEDRKEGSQEDCKEDGQEGCEEDRQKKVVGADGVLHLSVKLIA